MRCGSTCRTQCQDQRAPRVPHLPDCAGLLAAQHTHAHCDASQWAPADQAVRLPCAHMVCNQTPPIGAAPSLMSFREVETLFHEFGHALQHMLTQEREGLVSGIRGVEWDAVELPSQFMENWCYDAPTLMSFAKHHETGDALPQELFEKLKAARCAPLYLLGSACGACHCIWLKPPR